MDFKPLLYGLIGFFLGGLVVSLAATMTGGPAAKQMDVMVSNLRDKRGDDFDKAFITHMIEHHQSAVDMARLSDGRAKHDEIKQLSRDIISSQQAEIDRMRGWQRQWGYGAGHSPETH